MDLGIHQQQKISSKSLKGPAVMHCHVEVMHIDIYLVIYIALLWHVK